MPTMTTCCRKKAVLVAVYIEKPRKRGILSSNQQHHHHHHHHHHLHVHQAKNSANGKGYNRKAELLNYSRRLRESARSGASSRTTPLQPKPVSHHQPPMTQVLAVQSKPRHERVPTCLGNCKIMIPSFLKSLTMFQANKQNKKNNNNKKSVSTATTIKAVMKSFQVQRNKGFISKLFATFGKHSRHLCKIQEGLI